MSQANQQSSADRSKYPTAPGWYCIVFLLDGDERDYGPIYEFADGGWFDESGEQIESFYDPLLGLRVSVEAADDYVRQ